jgi:phosphoenolpyruvate-protein phosphotransferase
MRKGVPVSPGIAVARAFVVHDGLSQREPHQLESSDLAAELNRFALACTAAGHELDNIAARVSKELGEGEAAIFRAHRQLLRDPGLTGKVQNAIRSRHIDARTALQQVLDEYTALFEQIQDEYLRERMADVRDVVSRVLAHLDLEQNRHLLQADEPVIVATTEVLPSQALLFDRMHVAGILTETGGTTGHAAILARSLGIPAVSGLRGLLREIHTGELVALDGREGHVYLNPGPEVEAAYRKLQREYVDLRDRLIENRDQEPVSADGVRMDLLANVNGPADAVMAARVGAGGVGLYRTEYLFLSHPTVPDEDEQVAAYRAIIEASPNRLVTIRTLDLGGDKQVPYLGNHREANPFMGWRSIRLSSAHPEFFQTQMRAILRAGAFGQVHLLFPMVSTLEEVQQLKRMVERTRAALVRQKIPFGENISVGVMIEVPAAALCIDSLLKEVDFVSIGSNDLIQYVMAADRDNPKVAHLCEPFSPAIMRLLDQVIKACTAQGKPVTLCGEMAARPRCLLPLFGMGLRSASMSPAFIPPLKELLRCTTLKAAQDIAARVLAMRTVGEIRGFLTRKVRQICPSVAMLDVRK